MARHLIAQVDDLNVNIGNDYRMSVYAPKYLDCLVLFKRELHPQNKNGFSIFNRKAVFIVKNMNLTVCPRQ